MKRVIVFGASGLLGSELVPILAAHGCEVLAPLRSEADLLQSASIEAYIAGQKADAIINCAALIQVDAIEQDPLPARQINGRAPEAMARAARAQGMSFVHMSTQYVFDGKEPYYSEDMPMHPLNAYGASKAEGERGVIQATEESQSPWYIVRTSWIYGKKRPTFIDQVAGTLYEGRVFEALTDQRGNPTSAKDLAEAVVSNFIEQENESGIFHLMNRTQEEGVSRQEIALAVAGLIGVPASLVRETTSAAVFGTPRPSAVLLTTKLPPLRDWKEALQQYLAGEK